MDNSRKLLLFRYLFCGRDDVYAWRIPAGKRKGQYLPRRVPEYVLNDSTLVRHIKGHDLLGAYPMMRHNTTHWVGADFDGTNDNAFEEAWKLKEALEYLDVKTMCNTSQSGKGVHVRVIFTKTVPAWLARSLMIGCIEKEGILPLNEGGAFDRLFPAQDELDPHNPRAIGNQLGMPLNMKAIEERGGCVLLDDNFDKIELGPPVWDRLRSCGLNEDFHATDALQELGRFDLLLEPRDRKVLTMNVAEAWTSTLDPRSSYAEAPPKRKIVPLTNDDLSFTYTNCEFIEYAKRNHLNYNLWWALGAICIQFDGCGGRRLFHILSDMDPRYNSSKTEKKYNELLAKMRGPVKCSTFAKYGFECPSLGDDEMCDKFRNRNGRGPKTPATITYFVDIRPYKQAPGEGVGV